MKRLDTQELESVWQKQLPNDLADFPSTEDLTQSPCVASAESSSIPFGMWPHPSTFKFTPSDEPLSD
jgi:hypothetical protein